MPGYKVILVEPRNDFLCPHCKLVVRDAVQTHIGRILCLSCFKEIAEMQSLKCPCCRIEASSNFNEDKAVQKEVKDLLVRCNKYARGCDWQGRLRLLKEHLLQCRLAQEAMPCSNRGCGVIVSVDKLEQHAGLCPFQEATCEYCGEKHQLNKLGDHFRDCKQFPVTCPRCDDRFAREALTEHLKYNCNGSRPPSPDESVHLSLQSRPHEESQRDQEKEQPCWGFTCKELNVVPTTVVKQLKDDLAKERAQNLELKTQIFEIGQQLQSSNSNGTLIWKITELSRRRKALLEKKVPHIESPFFYTESCGYKMCIRIYLTGEKRHDSYLSVSIMILKGNHDNILKWPFTATVCLQLLNQSSSTRPPLQNSFNIHFPQSQMCHSVHQFAKLSDESTHYVKDDAMYLKCTVTMDTS